MPGLLAGPQNGIAAVDAFLVEQGAETTGGGPAGFRSVFADWMVANLLDADEGEFGYAGLDVEASITRTLRVGDEGEIVSLPQYGIDYVEVKGIDKGAMIQFEADGVTPILPDEPPDGGCWWTNRGDDTSTTLTRSVTVPTVGSVSTTPDLTFNLWHDIEEDWDYLYIQVSADDGETWDVLPAKGTTDANPLGNSYGHGYTGAEGWKEVVVPLADYGGQEVKLRFHYVTDDAIHGIGACLGDVALSWEDDSAPNRWEPDGFVRINNRVQQEWIVWVIGDDVEPTAERMPLRWDPVQEKYVGRMGTPAVDGDGRGGHCDIASSAGDDGTGSVSSLGYRCCSGAAECSGACRVSRCSANSSRPPDRSAFDAAPGHRR